VRSLDDRINGCHARAPGGKSDLKRIGTDNGIRVDIPPAVLCELFDRLHLFWGVYLGDYLLGQRLIRAGRAFGDEPGLIETPCNRAKPIRIFGMAAGIVLQENQIRVEQSHDDYP
jgi:hypothetical protein